MGSEDIPQQVQQVAYNPYNQPQQQNVYFQPQYIPQQPVYSEQPVLQGSSFYPQQPQVPLHQPMFVNGAPNMPAYPVHQPINVEQPQQEQQAEAPRACRWACSRERFRNFCGSLDAYRVGTFVTIMSFVAYFLFTPHAWPWFLLTGAISAGVCATKYVKQTRDMTEKEPRFLIHAAWYASLNTMMVLINLWSGKYSWSVFPLCIWGAALAFHALKIYNTNQFKTRLYSHFIIYVAVVVMLLVAGSRGRSTPFPIFIVIFIMSLLVAVHARKVRRDEQRRNSGDQQPAELQVVTENVTVPQQQHDAETANLVHQQQEVFNSIHQAQQDQRAQQNGQVHLFQPSVYPNAH